MAAKTHLDDNWPEEKKPEDYPNLSESIGTPGSITPFEIPGTVLTAIRQFMDFGKETTNESHNGYYGEGGWPYEVLKKFLGNCKE